ncbi:MAG: hypothetical protein QOJ99_2231 [Bryobacterales bacterium]|jgi:hypothetical protein|nr:hypothetical protein [Bryobacterales bacterium]
MKLAGLIRNWPWAESLIPSDHGKRATEVLVALSAVLLIFGAMPAKNRSNPFAWDLLLLSGFATFLAGLLATGSSKENFESMLDRLGRRGVISEIDRVKNAMDQIAARLTRVIASGVALSILCAFVAVILSDPAHASRRVGLCLFETAWAYVAGKRIGRLVAYGRLGSYLKASKTRLRVFPGHIDAAAGLKPLGAFCLHQTLILAIPAAFLAIWSLLIPAWPERSLRLRYAAWIHPYLGLLAITLLLETLVFVLPMWWFHRAMCSEKERLLEEADELSQKIALISSQLATARTSEERNLLKEELAFKTRQFWDIERMPTWPVDISLVRKFTVANVSLLVPLLGEVLGIHEKWIKLVEQSVENLHRSG